MAEARYLTRRGCKLCEERLPFATKAARLMGVALLVVDVDEALAERFGARVPVIIGPDDTVLAEGAFDRRQALRALWMARSG